MANTRRKMYDAPIDEGRKRVLAIVAGILVARHLKTTEDLFDNPWEPEDWSRWSLLPCQWAERMMRKIDSLFPPSGKV